jgi:hypothetical protein
MSRGSGSLALAPTPSGLTKWLKPSTPAVLRHSCQDLAGVSGWLFCVLGWCGWCVWGRGRGPHDASAVPPGMTANNSSGQCVTGPGWSYRSLSAQQRQCVGRQLLDDSIQPFDGLHVTACACV